MIISDRFRQLYSFFFLQKPEFKEKTQTNKRPEKSGSWFGFYTQLKKELFFFTDFTRFHKNLKKLPLFHQRLPNSTFSHFCFILLMACVKNNFTCNLGSSSTRVLLMEVLKLAKSCQSQEKLAQLTTEFLPRIM